MKNPGLNSLVLILIIVTLVILSSITLINEFEEEKVEAVKEITGKMHSFEVSSGDFNKHYPTKKNTKRYNDKLFEYLGITP